MRRRRYLATVSLVSTALAGCLGGSSDPEADPDTGTTGSDGDGDNVRTTTGMSNPLDCPSPPSSVDAVPGETVSGDGVELTLGEPITVDKYTDEYDNEVNSLDGAEFVVVPVETTVVGDNERTMPGEYMLSAKYLGHDIAPQGENDEEVTINGNTYTNILGQYTIGPSLYPGKSMSGVFIYQLPERHDSGGVTFTAYLTERSRIDDLDEGTKTLALGAPEGVTYPCPDPREVPSEPLAFGERITYGGYEMTMREYIKATKVTNDSGAVNTPMTEGAAYLIVTAEVKNVGRRGLELIDSPTVKYAGEAVDHFLHHPDQMIDGKRYKGLGLADYPITDGYAFYPGTTVSGSFFYTVPENMDPGKLSVQYEFESDPETVVTWEPS